MLKALTNMEYQKEVIKLTNKKPKVFVKGKTDMHKAINAYLNGQTGRYGKYFALPNALVHRKVMYDNNGHNADLKQDIIAMNLNGIQVGNSSILPWIDATSTFGNVHTNRSVHEVQTLISQFITMIPFTVFQQAGLDIRQYSVIERGLEENVKVKVDNPKYKYTYKSGKYTDNGQPKTILETRHFTGAMLFKIEDKMFLFDIDREEIKHHIFNPFLVQLPKEVKTISDAYIALKPLEVLTAEMNELEVIRQGEWFFIPVKGDFKPDTTTNRFNNNKTINKRIELRAGNNRPNYAEKGTEKLMLVSGKVEHSGREHRTIMLKGWYKAVPNTSIESFTITGDID